jgi:hypothetical protein
MRRRTKLLPNDCLFLKVYHNGFAAKDILLELIESVYRLPEGDTKSYVLASWKRMADSNTVTYSVDWQMLFVCCFLCFPDFRDAIYDECNELSWFMAYGYLLSRWVAMMYQGPVLQNDYLKTWVTDCLFPLAYPNADCLFAATQENLLQNTLTTMSLKDCGQYEPIKHVIPTYEEWLSLKGHFWSVAMLKERAATHHAEISHEFLERFMYKSEGEDDATQLAVAHELLQEKYERRKKNLITHLEYETSRITLSPGVYIK